MSQVFQAMNTHKQSFYQMLERRDFTQEETGQILYLVNQVRKDHPRMSVREIYGKINPTSMGRDRFEQLCYENGYKVSYRKNYRKTTDSRGVIRFPNRIKDIEVTGVNQVFVSDITYFELKGAFCYITLIMDLYNREIVGYHASDSLRTEHTTLPTMYKVVKERGKSNLKGAVIHSDGGGQYYSKDFCQLTKELGLINSMTEESVYENAHAERLNGIIKNNYLYPYAPKSLKELNIKLKKAVRLYNNEKKHRALDNRTPVEYRLENTINDEDNRKSYLPSLTVNNNKHIFIN